MAKEGNIYYVDLGKGSGAYQTRLTTENEAQAWAVYRGYNVHSGYKKRLRRIGKSRRVKVLARLITYKGGAERHYPVS